MEFQAFHSSSAGNLYRVSSGKHSLLLECGVPLDKIKQAFGYSFWGIKACLITHSHRDHSRSAKELLRLGININCSVETAHALNIHVDEHNLNLIEPIKMFTHDPFNIMPFPVAHDVPGSLGYLISDGHDKLLFAIDTAYIGPRFKGLTCICIECNWSEKTLAPDLDPYVKRRLLKSHMSLETCEKFLLAQDLEKVKEIHLLHCSINNSDVMYFQKRIRSLFGIPTYIAKEK